MTENVRLILAVFHGTAAGLMFGEATRSSGNSLWQFVATALAVVSVWGFVRQILKIEEMRRDGK